MSRALELVVINLERSADRRAAMAAQLDALGLEYRFFKAIDGSRGEHLQFRNYSDAACSRRWRRTLSPGEVGCFASHYLVWKECVQTSKNFLILEDDVALSKDFVTLIDEIRSTLRHHQLIRLAGTIPRPARKLDVAAISNGRYLGLHSVGPRGTTAYLLTPDGAMALIKASDVWDEPVDHVVDRFWSHGLLSVSLLPYPIEARSQSASTIGERRKALPRGRFPKLRRELRRFVDDFARYRFLLAWRATSILRWPSRQGRNTKGSWPVSENATG